MHGTGVNLTPPAYLRGQGGRRAPPRMLLVLPIEVFSSDISSSVPFPWWPCSRTPNCAGLGFPDLTSTLCSCTGQHHVPKTPAFPYLYSPCQLVSPLSWKSLPGAISAQPAACQSTCLGWQSPRGAAVEAGDFSGRDAAVTCRGLSLPAVGWGDSQQPCHYQRLLTLYFPAASLIPLGSPALRIRWGWSVSQSPTLTPLCARRASDS